MNEKKFTYILVSTAILAIIIVILIYIPWGGDKAAIRKEFTGLDKNHVYETINYDDVFKKINSGETFQLFVGTSQTVDEQSFAYEANELAKINNVKTIYYLKLTKLTVEQLANLKEATSHYTEFPSLFYFEMNEDKGVSSAFNISGLKDLEDFDGNWRSLITQYFKDCYENK